MDETLSYDYLWQAYQKEKQTNQLLLLSKNFYEDVAELISGGATSTPGSTIEPSMRENAKRLLNDFFEKRKQKIMIYIAYNRQLPQPISSNELEFYNKVLQIVKSERLDNVKSKEVKQTFKPMLKSIKDIPEIILPSGSKFGPLRKDETFEAGNEEDKIYLVENAICEEVR